ncbi:MAG: RIP metalloprotease RseP [Flavobacteriales bacterium]|jgi:regulator of sigma E protease|nr:RIP metalloprotease RseP [Flavobacteriales bacterium]
MDILIKVAQLLMSLSLLVVLHELGHFIPAKLFKTKVEKFYLFFDAKFSLFKKKIGETEYGIGWLPLGGYVKIAGMVDESMDTEQLEKEPQPWEFRSKPAWQRLIIMAGGIIVNIIVAMAIFIGILFFHGEEYIKMDSLKDGVWVTNTDLGDKLGIKSGDKISKIDDKEIVSFQSIYQEILVGESITIDRYGEEITQQIPEDFINSLIESEERKMFLYARVPYMIRAISKESANIEVLKPKDRIISIGNIPIDYYDQALEIQAKFKGQTTGAIVERDGKREQIQLAISDEGKLGVQAIIPEPGDLSKLGIVEVDHVKYGFFEAIPAGITMTYDQFMKQVKSFKKILNPSTGAYKGLGGVISMGKLFPDSWDWLRFWRITGLLSVMLAFLNLLPIPALDGGHIVFTTYEMITGRKPHQKVLEVAQYAGIIILLSLMLFANGKDIFNLFQ